MRCRRFLISKAFFKILDVHEADNRAQGTTLSENERKLVEEVRNTAEKIVNSGECYSYSGLKINGSDLIAIGFKGEEVGSTLNKILIDVIEGRTADDRDILLKKAAKMYERKEAGKRR